MLKQISAVLDTYAYIIGFTMERADANVCLQLAEVWKLIEPTITKCLPEKLASGSNGG